MSAAFEPSPVEHGPGGDQFLSCGMLMEEPPRGDAALSGYDFALFLHVLFIVALFAALAIVLVGMGGSRRAQTVQAAREWAHTAAVVARLLPLFSVLAFVPAGYMVGQRWSWRRGWIEVAAVSLLLLFVGFVYLAMRLVPLSRRLRAAADGPLPVELRRRALDPSLWFVAQTTSTVGTGVIVLMTFKPSGGVAIWVIVVSALLGALSTAPAVVRLRRLEAADVAAGGV